MQDFEHWDDVGLNISKPPDLLHLYLDFGKHTAPLTNSSDASTCDDFYKEDMEELRKQLHLVVSNIVCLLSYRYYIYAWLHTF